MRRLVVIAFLAACGGDPCPGGTHQVHVRVLAEGASMLAGYRAGTGAWTMLGPSANGEYDVCAADDFTFLDVCGSPSGIIDAVEVASTVAEGSAVTIDGCGTATDPAGVVRVMVSVSDAAFIDLGLHTAVFPQSGVAFIDTPPGTRTLIATNSTMYTRPPASPLAVIRRDLSITGPTTLPAIDFAADGTPMDVAPLSITGLEPSDTFMVTDVYLTRGDHDAWVWYAESSTAYLVPQSLVVTGDRHRVTFYATDRTAGRSIDARFAGAPPAMTLPPKLTGLVTKTSDGTAHWTALPPFTRLELDAASPNIGGQRIFASSGWLARHGGNELSFDDSAPGYVHRFGGSDLFTLYQDDGDATAASKIGL